MNDFSLFFYFILSIIWKKILISYVLHLVIRYMCFLEYIYGNYGELYDYYINAFRRKQFLFFVIPKASSHSFPFAYWAWYRHPLQSIHLISSCVFFFFPSLRQSKRTGRTTTTSEYRQSEKIQLVRLTTSENE
jgi:hypothetical protein